MFLLHMKTENLFLSFVLACKFFTNSSGCPSLLCLRQSQTEQWLHCTSRLRAQIISLSVCQTPSVCADRRPAFPKQAQLRIWSLDDNPPHWPLIVSLTKPAVKKCPATRPGRGFDLPKIVTTDTKEKEPHKSSCAVTEQESLSFWSWKGQVTLYIVGLLLSWIEMELRLSRRCSTGFSLLVIWWCWHFGSHSVACCAAHFVLRLYSKL